MASLFTFLSNLPTQSGGFCVCVSVCRWFMATSEPDLLSELAWVCSETQFLKRGLFGDGVSDVLEIPQILPVVLCRSPPAGGVKALQTRQNGVHCFPCCQWSSVPYRNPLSHSSPSCLAIISCPLKEEAREHYKGFAVETIPQTEGTESTAFQCCPFQLNWPYQRQWFPVRWGDLSASWPLHPF